MLKCLWIFPPGFSYFFAYILAKTFFFVSAISSGLLQSDYVEPYTDQVNSQLEVSPISHINLLFF